MVHEVPPNQASGWKLGEHGSWCKHTNFDIDTRAPLIVRAPGLGSAGARTFGLTEFVDMYPTLCETCDLPLPDHLEGQSLVRLMEEPETRVEGGGLQPVSEAEGGHRRRPRRPAARRRRPRRNGLYDADARLPLHGVAGARDRRGEGAGTVRPSRGCR